MKVKNVGNHAEDLADGRMLAPGEVADLTDEQVEDPFNAAKIDEGVFMDVSDVPSLSEEDLAPNATDAAAELAASLGVELGLVTGTGSGGRITVDDVQTYFEQRGAQA